MTEEESFPTWTPLPPAELSPLESVLAFQYTQIELLKEILIQLEALQSKIKPNETERKTGKRVQSKSRRTKSVPQHGS